MTLPKDEAHMTKECDEWLFGKRFLTFVFSPQHLHMNSPIFHTNTYPSNNLFWHGHYIVFNNKIQTKEITDFWCNSIKILFYLWEVFSYNSKSWMFLSNSFTFSHFFVNWNKTLNHYPLILMELSISTKGPLAKSIWWSLLKS